MFEEYLKRLVNGVGMQVGCNIYDLVLFCS